MSQRTSWTSRVGSRVLLILLAVGLAFLAGRLLSSDVHWRWHWLGLTHRFHPHDGSTVESPPADLQSVRLSDFDAAIAAHFGGAIADLRFLDCTYAPLSRIPLTPAMRGTLGVCVVEKDGTRRLVACVVSTTTAFVLGSGGLDPDVEPEGIGILPAPAFGGFLLSVESGSGTGTGARGIGLYRLVDTRLVHIWWGSTWYGAGNSIPSGTSKFSFSAFRGGGTRILELGSPEDGPRFWLIKEWDPSTDTYVQRAGKGPYD